MKKVLFLAVGVALIALTFATHAVEARGRYGSIRVGGINSNGKGSHYIGGYVRSCQGWACR